MPKVTAAHEQQRRVQILDAAVACFARQGYRATSMEDIVRESGLSVGAIYTYFPSKEELFLALADQRMNQAVDYIRALFDGPGPVQDKLREAVDFYFHQLETELAPYARISFEFWSEAPKFERLRERHAIRTCRIRDLIVDLLSNLQKRGEMRGDVDPSVAAELIMALNDGLLMHHVTGVQTHGLDVLKAAYISFLNAGFSNTGHAFLADAAPSSLSAASLVRSSAPLLASASRGSRDTSSNGAI